MRCKAVGGRGFRIDSAAKILHQNGAPQTIRAVDETLNEFGKHDRNKNAGNVDRDPNRVRSDK